MVLGSSFDVRELVESIDDVAVRAYLLAHRGSAVRPHIFLMISALTASDSSPHSSGTEADSLRTATFVVSVTSGPRFRLRLWLRRRLPEGGEV